MSVHPNSNLVNLGDGQRSTLSLLKDKLNNVYIGRASGGLNLKASKWGNPFTVDLYGREEAVRLYEEYILANRSLLEEVVELRGKTVVLVSPKFVPRPNSTPIGRQYIDKYYNVGERTTHPRTTT
jgi:hypothetical protein